MKFILTAVHVSRLTRKRVGKARTEIVDITRDPFYAGARDAHTVEQRFQIKWDIDHPGSETEVKVVDVREAFDGPNERRA